MTHLRKHNIHEEWHEIPEFPDYEINQYGEVYNKRIKKIISASSKGENCTAVNLRRDDNIYACVNGRRKSCMGFHFEEFCDE